MDSRDEEFTLEEVDEQIEQLLARLQTPHPPQTFFAHTIRNLQIIYEEDRRLDDAWARINRSAPMLSFHNAPRETDEPLAVQPFQEEKKTWQQTTTPLDVGSFHSTPLVPDKPFQQPRRWQRRNFGIILVAAMLLIIIFSWPLFSSALRSIQSAGSQIPTQTASPQAQPTQHGPALKEFDSPYFKIQYPATWMITTVTTGGNYLQTVQFRPSATSPVEFSVDVLLDNASSADQLLHNDADVKLGTLGTTHTVVYHGIPWTVGTINLAGSAQAPLGKLEIAYSKQENPYRIKFGATRALFDAYTPTFNAMFASFYAQTRLAATPTIVPAPTLTPTPPTLTPSPTTMPSPTAPVPNINEYTGQYFKIQYPTSWVITSITTDGTYLQTVQFRPSASSPVFVNVSAMSSNDLTADLLLLIDPDVKLGALLGTNTVTYHGLPWVVGTVNPLSSGEKLEIAYSNQKAPYRIEFGAPSGVFDSYTSIFNTMFASFYPVNQ